MDAFFGKKIDPKPYVDLISFDKASDKLSIDLDGTSVADIGSVQYCPMLRGCSPEGAWL